MGKNALAAGKRGQATPAAGKRGQATPAAGKRGQATAVPAAPETVSARAGALAAGWAPVAGRVLLALVLAWFGYHELVQPGLWTGYVPVLSPTSSLAVILVLAHGWVLLMLAVALAAGLATRLAALAAAVVLLEIVIALIITAGLSDLTLRDIGVLGLAICLTGVSSQRLALRK